jgi:hypothetical protein
MRAAQIGAREIERRFPVRIRIAVPPAGLGKQLTQMQDWLDHNAGADGWGMTPSGERGVLNDALAIHLVDGTIRERLLSPPGASAHEPKQRMAYSEFGKTRAKASDRGAASLALLNGSCPQQDGIISATSLLAVAV